MTPEQLLLTAVSTVTAALVFVCNLLWKEAEACKTERIEMRKELGSVHNEIAHRNGRLEAYQLCPNTACPFKLKL